jgi:hypothetical protein
LADEEEGREKREQEESAIELKTTEVSCKVPEEAIERREMEK